MSEPAEKRRLAYLQALGISAWRRRLPGTTTAGPAPEPAASPIAAERPRRWLLWVADADAAERWRGLIADLCRLLNGPGAAVEDAVVAGWESPREGAVLALCDHDDDAATASGAPFVHAGDPDRWARDEQARRALWRRLQEHL